MALKSEHGAQTSTDHDFFFNFSPPAYEYVYLYDRLRDTENPKKAIYRGKRQISRNP